MVSVEGRSETSCVKSHKVSDNPNSSNCLVVPLQSPSRNDNRPYVKAQLFDVSVFALLDCGANCSVVGNQAGSWVNNLVVFPTSFDHTTTADGSKQKVTGSVKLPLRIAGKTFFINALFVPNLNVSVILGVDFLKLFCVKLDFSEDEIHLKDPQFIKSELLLVDSNNGVSGRSKLSSNEQLRLTAISDKFRELGSRPLGRTHLMTHVIDTGNAKPFKSRQYNMSPYVMEKLKEEINKMLDLGVIRKSSSPWSSPVVMVRKKNGEYRFCFDGRALNAVTTPDRYPLPLLNNILNSLRNARYISSIDLAKAFWQIPLDESSRPKTAFSIPGVGQFEFIVMPFGLSTAAQAQQKLIDTVIGPALEPYVFAYLDDIIIVTPDIELHFKILNEVYERLEGAGLTVNFEKCDFCKSSLKYLGFVVNEMGLCTDPDKVSAMLEYPVPKTATEVKRFIGLFSWYRRFIKEFSTLVAPICDLIKGKKKKQPIEWTEEADEAFKNIKNVLVSAPVLAAPRFDLEFIVQSDSSDVGLGAVLTQIHPDGDEHVIAYASRTLSRAERNYSTSEKECLGLLFAVEKFRPYIEGVKFKAITDHYSLLWLRRLKDPVGRLARWALKLAQYDMELSHRKGKLHVVPDALSRIPSVDKDNLNVETIDVNASDDWYSKQLRNVDKFPEKYPDWRSDEGKLYKLLPCDNGVPFNATEWRLVVPLRDRQDVLKLCHDSPTAAHFGFFKTYKRVCELYYWPKMKKDIQKYVRMCKTCGAQKHPNGPKAGLMGRQKLVKHPFEIISCDLVGPLPRSKRGFCWLLVVTDWFSKWVMVQPLRRATHQEIINFLENTIFLTFGVPKYIMVDNGPQFISKAFKDFAKEYGVHKIWYNARYHPQVNFTERVNKVIGTAIRSYLTDNEHNQWDLHIFKLASAIRSAVHEVTQYSPNVLLFGRQIPLHGSFYGNQENDREVEVNTDSRNSYLENFESLKGVYDDIGDRLRKAYERNARAYNLRKKHIRFNVGDIVWKRNYVLSDASKRFSAKLAPRYIICTVSKVISPLVYNLANEKGVDIGNWHIKDIKPYFGEDEVAE